MSAKTYKNLIFDVGNVLFQYRWKAMLMDYGLPESEAERIGRELFSNPKWHTYDLGIETDEEICHDYQKLYPDDAKAIEYFMRHGEYMHVPRPEIWERIHTLKQKGYHLYLLSNYPEKLFKKHVEYADFMNDLDGMMVSYMIHIGKPDARIYEALLNKYDLKAEDCLFFDDREENVEAAQKLHIGTVHVTSREMLAQELDQLIAP